MPENLGFYFFLGALLHLFYMRVGAADFVIWDIGHLIKGQCP